MRLSPPTSARLEKMVIKSSEMASRSSTLPLSYTATKRAPSALAAIARTEPLPELNRTSRDAPVARLWITMPVGLDVRTSGSEDADAVAPRFAPATVVISPPLRSSSHAHVLPLVRSTVTRLVSELGRKKVAAFSPPVKLSGPAATSPVAVSHKIARPPREVDTMRWLCASKSIQLIGSR
jgi:hypothetical protein